MSEIARDNETLYQRIIQIDNSNKTPVSKSQTKPNKSASALDRQTKNNLKKYRAFVQLVGGPDNCVGYIQKGQSLNIKRRMDDIRRIVNDNKVTYHKLSGVKPTEETSIATMRKSN